MEKNRNKIITALFVCFIGGFFLANILLPDIEFSPNENRYLQRFPRFSFASLADGSFTEKAELYSSDQFALRDRWITLKARLELLQGKRENNGVFLCSDERLIEPYTAPDEALIEKRCAAVNALTDRLNIPVTLALIPGAAEIYGEQLPAGVRNDSQRQTAAEVYSLVRTGHVDLGQALEAHRDEYIFYRTDHHWTSLGALYAAESILESAGASLSPNKYAPRTVSESFCGTAYSTSGFFWVKPDTIQVFIDAPQGLRIEKYEDAKPVSAALYDEEKLDTKDKYRFFLGGNCPRVHISTGKEGLPSLLILRDSYADSLVPFLLDTYSQIHLLDLRYYRASAAQYAKDNDIDSVLILYSVSDFVSDPSLDLLAQ